MIALLAQAWQSWKSDKTVALLVVVAFTVGIGSVTTIYTVVDAMLLKPVPYRQGERFVSLLGASSNEPGPRRSSLMLQDALEFERRMRSFDLFGWMRYSNYNLTAPGHPQHLTVVEVTPALANGIGVNPRLGRWFQNRGDGPAAVISHGLWLSLGADPAMPGKSITLNGRIFSVVGVMPRGFQLPLAGYYGEAKVDVWLPLDPAGRGQDPRSGPFFSYARLKPGVTAAQADAEAQQVAVDVAKRDPETHQFFTARADDLHMQVTKDIKPALTVLFAGAGVLLLITCVNAGGLLLARSVARGRETAIRVALGAQLRQLAVQYFVESLLVGLAGAAGGLLFSATLIPALVAFAAEAGPVAETIAIDRRVLLFALGATFLASALSSLVPLWQAARPLPADALSEGVRASASARSRRLSQSLVIAEVALAFVLLGVSAVLTAEFYRLMRVRLGFDASQLLTFRLAIAKEDIPGKASHFEYQTRVLQALEAVPGVAGVGYVNQLPLNGCCFSTSIYPEAATNPSRGERVSFLPINSGFITTMRIPLQRGRIPDERDTNDKMLPVAINQAAAKRYWPNQDPVGAFGHFNHPKGDRFQVVGVVGDVKNEGLDSATVPEIYLPSAAVPVNPLNFVVRSTLPPKTLVPEVRRAIQKINPSQPIDDVRTMEEIVADSLTVKRMASYVMSFFALAALLMATIGAYGVVSYSVRQRTVEIGARMALGATGGNILGLVIGSGLWMAAYGIAIGGVASIGAASLLMRELSVQQPGILPFVLSGGVVGLVALASSWAPAWRATLLSPMVAIRNDPGSMWESTRRPAAPEREAVAPDSTDGSLAADLIEASRHATTFRDAVRAALEALRAGAGAERVLLLEEGSAEEFRATAFAGSPGAGSCSIPKAGLLAGRLRFYPAPLPLPADQFEVWRRWATEFKPASLSEIETLSDAGARLAMPLRTKKDVVGVVLLGSPTGGQRYSDARKRLLRGAADQLALLLENARLTDRVLEQEKLRRDVALAAEVQQRLFPRRSLETAAASFAGVNLPARSVGGDYYDFLELGPSTGIALADVAGKGVPAALVMSVVQASLRVISSEPGIPLPDLAARMNHFLYRSTGPNSYATFFYGQLDEKSRQFRYVNAGHNPPFLLRACTGTIEELPAGGTIIGMFPRAQYEEGVIPLCRGDVLMVFTDGVTEALNPAEEEFGELRLATILRQAIHLPVEEMSVQIAQGLRDWIEDAPLYDDLTLALMKVK
jgi:predicted permease